MPAGTVWSFDETRMAFALYFLIGPSKADARNGDVQSLAQAIGRTPSSVALKLANIASFDQNRLSEGHSGMSHASKLDQQVWVEYDGKGDEFLGESTTLLASTLRERKVPAGAALSEVVLGQDSVPEGKEQVRLVTGRVNQRYFREVLLALYGGRCCVTGLAIPELLVASHIKPWSVADPRTERLLASNGLLLNALHDKAFDRGLMTIDQQWRVRISGKVRRSDEAERWLWAFDRQPIALPRAHRPSREFIAYHNDVVFQG